MPTVSGVVLDAAGKPVAQARVFIAKAPSPVPDIAAVTGRDGRFELGAPSMGLYEIACNADDLGSASATVNVGTRAATVELRLGRR